MSDKTGLAMVGVGYWGPAIVRNLAALERAELLHVVDQRPARAHEVASRHCPEAQAHADLARALADERVQAVVVATPVRSHAALVRQALEAGKHVFVEKPLAMDRATCVELDTLARRQGRVLMVGHIFLFNAAVQQVKQLIDSGELGDIHYVVGRRVNLGRVQADINALWSFAPHDLSILRYWLGGDPVSVQARGFDCLRDGVEDVVFCTLEYPGGVGAHLHVGWLDPRKVREMTVVGTRKMVVFDDVSPGSKLQIYDRSVHPVPASTNSFAEWQVDIRHGDVTIPRLQWVEPLRAELSHFLDCVRDGVACRTPASDGTAVTAAIVAAHRSLASGRAEPVEPLR